MRVLVVDDHQIDVKLIGAVLHMSGHTVEEQHTAQGAMETLSRSPPDVVLLDLNLPDLSGFELIATVRNALAPHEVPIVALTAYPQRYRREDVLAAGCCDFIAKPIDTRTLAQVLRRAAGTGTWQECGY